MTGSKLVARLLAAFSVIVVFAIVTPLRAIGSEQVLYNFCPNGTGGDCPDGKLPVAALISDTAGNLYGTTFSGGHNGYGAVFELIPSNGTWTEKVLHSFNLDGQDGTNPAAAVAFDAAGNLYGTTVQGGVNNSGTVFELIPNNGTWAESVLHSFGHAKDGATPQAGVILDSVGNLYGTTETGGVAGAGTVFELILNGGVWTEKVLHSFDTKYGFELMAGLTMDGAGNLYGTTFVGGVYGYGTVFELIPNGGKWTLNVLHSFNIRYGAYPLAGVILDAAGNIYGTTSNGGAYRDGVVFELISNNGKWTEKVLHNFNGKFGMNPQAGLILDSSGNLYGTTSQGGLHNGGTVFELMPNNGKWTENVLRGFSKGSNNNGTSPEASLILDGAGNLYGTTRLGGSKGWGTVFEITP